ncbi:hypothetical protein [Pseudomonas pergaminensis]
MAEFNIPQPDSPSSVPSETTKKEIAAMGAAQRSTYLYERSIEELNKHIETLKSSLSDVTKQNTKLSADGVTVDYLRCKISMLKRAKIEMFVAFVIATIFMAVGGGLISSYPSVNGVFPWQFVLGWAFIFLSIIFGVLSRVVVWGVYYFFKEDNVLP